MQKLTAIWQSENPHEREWVDEVFGPYISEHVIDGKHELAMDNAILIDAFVHCFDQAYYAKFRGLNAYLVQFLDENYDGGYDRYENFRGVFRGHWSSVFNANYVRKMPLGYCNGLPKREQIIPAAQRKYVWSFAGHVDKSSRPEMAEELARVEPHYLFSSSPIPGFVTPRSTSEHRRLLPSAAYYDLLFDSTFSPCPMGNVNLECFRVYEALECGSIPIVEKRLTMDYFRTLFGDHPIPTVRCWKEGRHLIDSLLGDPHGLNVLQDKCMDWWKNYKKEYSASVGHFLAGRSTVVPQIEPAVSSRYRMPFWQPIELLRHHNARAAIKRIRRQATRLLQNGRLRVAHRPSSMPSKSGGLT
jgi:hypothetical protein